MLSTTAPESRQITSMNSGLLLSRWGRKLGKRLMRPRLSPMPEEDPQRWNIVRGDLVEVIQGPSVGQKGKVLTIIRDSARVIIDGVNMVQCCVFFALFVKMR